MLAHAHAHAHSDGHAHRHADVKEGADKSLAVSAAAEDDVAATARDG